jgi:Xaa-Pro aminopeptidase
MKPRMSGGRQGLRAAAALVALAWAAISAAPSAPQEAGGRAAASIEAARAPAVAARRARLRDICKDGIVVIPSQYRARDGMRDNLNFLYLTGLREAGAVLVLDAGGEQREILFRPGSGRPGTPNPADGATPRSPDPSPPAPEAGIVERPGTQLPSTLFALIRAGRAKRAYLPFSDLDLLSRTFGASGVPSPLAQAETILNVDPILAEMRLTKDADEIAALREAVDLTAAALNEAFRAARPGLREVDLAAILRFAFDRRETEDSFLQVASGPNATNVHFGATARPLAAGDLVVFDVGAYIRGYTSDISRTIPAGGRFTKEQRDIYGLVLEAQEAGCRGLVPGVTFKAVQTEVENILLAGLEKLGLVTDIGSPWQRRLYIQHGFGHGIGLDVHDSWAWHSPRLDKVVMVPGMVMAMEPGLYFPPVRFDAFLDALKSRVPDAEIAAFRDKVGPVYRKYAGIGVRIEDDILITADGNEVLSLGVPKETAEIEKLMREKSLFDRLR